MRWDIVSGLLLWQVKGSSTTALPIECGLVLQDFVQDTYRQADACTYTGRDEDECRTSPDNCVLVPTTYFDIHQNSCKRFTNITTAVCNAIGAEAKHNVTVDAILAGKPAGLVMRDFWELLIIQTMRHTSCRNQILSLLQENVEQHQQQMIFINETLNRMCIAKAESNDDTDNLAVGLGVGLGVGLPLVGGIIYFVVRRSKAPKATESLEPFLS